MLILVYNKGLVNIALHSFGHADLSQRFKIIDIVILGLVDLDFAGRPIVGEGEELFLPAKEGVNFVSDVDAHGLL